MLFELKKCCVNRARKILLALRSHRRRKRLFFFLSRFFSCDEYFLQKMGSVAVKHNPPKLIEKRHQTGIYMHACLCRAKTMNEKKKKNTIKAPKCRVFGLTAGHDRLKVTPVSRAVKNMFVSISSLWRETGTFSCLDCTNTRPCTHMHRLPGK